MADTEVSNLQLIDETLAVANKRYAESLDEKSHSDRTYWRDAVALFNRVREFPYAITESDLKMAREVVKHAD